MTTKKYTATLKYSYLDVEEFVKREITQFVSFDTLNEITDLLECELGKIIGLTLEV